MTAVRGFAASKSRKMAASTWSDATLGQDLGKYSWRRWQTEWTPPEKGTLSPDGARDQ